MSHASPRPGAPTFPISQAHYQQHQQQLQQQQMLQHQQQQQQAMQHQQLLQAQQQQQALQAQQQHALPPQQPRVPMAVHAPQQTPQQQHYSPMPSSLPPRAAGGGAPMPPRHAAPALPSQNGLLHASARAEKRERMPKDGGERYYLRGGPSNFLLLSLRSGLPSHIDWALARLLDASLNHADRFTWEKWPGLTDTLLRFPMRVVAAVKGAPETEWAPRFFETEEQADADEALGWTSAPPMLGVTRPAKRQRADETALPGTSRLGALSTGAGAFRPAQDDSHAALARWAVLASTILRNLSLHGSFVRHMYTHTRGMPTLIADVLTLDCLALEADAWAELEALREMRGIWLDVCESVAPMLIFSPPADAPAPLVAAGKANMKAAELAGDAILGAVVSFIVHAEDRQLLVASLRIIGVLAELERNEHLFASGRPIYPEGPTVQAVVQRCAQLVALDASADPALVESALDCLYQLLRIDGFNALRLAADGVVISHKPAAQDAFGLVRLLVRCLACRRVSWPRTHNIQVHPQLHAGIPTRRALEEQERRARFAGLAPEQAAAKEASNRWLTKWEVQRVAGLPEPERLTTWLKMIYEPRAKSEVTQVELWETYRDQFTPYSQHGTPTAVQPAAEVIRIASVAFPGATAMVQNGTRFVITGVARRDRSSLRKFQCCWRGCADRDNETAASLTRHVLQSHLEDAPSACAWHTCAYAVPPEVAESGRAEQLRRHVLTHLAPAPEPAEAPAERSPDSLVKAKVIDKDPRGRMLLLPDLAASKKGQKRRGTVDNPEPIAFRVTRTPMDGSSRPLGIAGTAALILRSLARTAAGTLDRAPAGHSARRQQGAGKADETAMQDADEDRFGLPLPVGGRMDLRGVVRSSDATDEPDVVERASSPIAAVAPFSDETADFAEWQFDAAAALMDALGAVEQDVVDISGENDILCPILNETLHEIRPAHVESLIPEEDETEGK